MEEYELTGLILDSLNRHWDEIIYKNIELGNLIHTILILGSLLKVSKELNIGNKALEYNILKIFGIKDKRISWRHWLIDKTKYHICVTHNLYLLKTEFSVDNATHNKLNNICKQCDNNRKYYYRKENLDKCREISKRHYRNNKSDYLARNAKRKADLLNATPIWADLNKIKLIYKLRPKDYHVDHIIPLQGELVCGLHVEYNLQYLLAKDNLSKGNRF